MNVETDVDQTWQVKAWAKGDPLEVIGGNPDLHVDSRSLSHFLHHCGIGDFWTFVSISYTINGHFFPYLAK